MTAPQQMKLLNQGSYLTRIGSEKKPFTIKQALKMFDNLGVK